MKFLIFFQGIQNKEHILRVNKTKSTGEKACNGDYFETKGNHESSNYKIFRFLFFLHILDP